jgi:soluble P-type ATPase
LPAILQIHVLTADTFGGTATELDGLPVNLSVMPTTYQAEAKLGRVNELGAAGVVAIGDGRNDHKMLEAAAIGIAVMQKDGVSAQALGAADDAWRRRHEGRHQKSRGPQPGNP